MLGCRGDASAHHARDRRRRPRSADPVLGATLDGERDVLCRAIRDADCEVDLDEPSLIPRTIADPAGVEEPEPPVDAPVQRALEHALRLEPPGLGAAGFA